MSLAVTSLNSHTCALLPVISSVYAVYAFDCAFGNASQSSSIVVCDHLVGIVPKVAKRQIFASYALLFSFLISLRCYTSLRICRTCWSPHYSKLSPFAWPYLSSGFCFCSAAIGKQQISMYINFGTMQTPVQNL